MSILLAANNAESQLAAGISAVALTAQLTPGTGVLFPSPNAGQYFKLTFLDAASTQLREIVHVTNVTGDTITMVRGQEGTTAKAYLAGDIAGELFTAGSFQALVQAEQLQAGSYTKASAVGGTANAITATLPSTLTTLVDGLTILVPATAANTGAAAIVVTLGVTAQSSVPIVKSANQALAAGDIPGAGYPAVLTYSSAYGAFVLNAVASGFLSNQVNVPILDSAGVQRMGFASGGATSVQGQGTSPINFKNGGGTLIGALSATGMLSVLADAVSAGDVPRFGQMNARPGHTYTVNDWAYIDKSMGLIIQWGTSTAAASAAVAANFAISFASAGSVLGIYFGALPPAGSTVITAGALDGSVTASGFQYFNTNTVGSLSSNWVALGLV